MITPTRIVVADDHSLFRQGLVELLRTVDDLRVEGEAENGDEAIKLAMDLKPDIVILDVGMPGPDPSFTIRAIRTSSPVTRILIVTMFDDPHLVHELIHAGADGYLLKSATRDELATAIHSISKSDGMVHISISRQAFAGLSRTGTATKEALTPREASVLRLLAEARSNRDIGLMLNITDATVKRHLSNIYAKLGVTSRIDAVVTAQRAGIIHD